MKPHCPQCKRIIEQVTKAFEDLDSPDPVKVCAAELTLSMVIDEKYEPLDGGKRWHVPEERMPAEAFCPHEYIREELAERRWDVRRLASEMGVSRERLIGFLKKKMPISSDIAQQLAKAFRTSPEFWMNLEKAWRDWLAASPLPLSEQEGR